MGLGIETHAFLQLGFEMIFLGQAMCWQAVDGAPLGAKPQFKLDYAIIEADNAQEAKDKYREWLKGCNVTIDSVAVREMIR
jgi:hypothetical protein